VTADTARLADRASRVRDLAHHIRPKEAEMTIARLLARICIGIFFIGHGTQKLFGWFGGPGLDQAGEGFEQLGLHPGRRHATAAGAAETAGGAMILTGTATPLAASLLTSVMLTAIDRVHRPNGPWNSDGGYEYNVVLIAALLTLVEAGPGSLSVDRARGREHRGFRWSLAALAAGAAGFAGARQLARRQQPEATDPQHVREQHEPLAA
jgi:putative oxidoreductase